MLHFGAESLPAGEREKMSEALSKSKVLETVYTMRQDLAAHLRQQDDENAAWRHLWPRCGTQSVDQGEQPADRNPHISIDGTLE